MAAVKVVLRKEIKADGTSPLAIRITKDRKTSYLYLEYSVRESDWDKPNQRVKKSHPNSARLNNYLLKKLAEVTNSALETETSEERVNAQLISTKVKPRKETLFFAVGQDYLDQLKANGKYNQYTADKPRIARFKAFRKNTDLAFDDISVGMLERFSTHLKNLHISSKSEAKDSKPMEERTIVNHLSAIRSVFSHARKNKIITKGSNPFGGDGIKIEFPETTKVGVSTENIIMLENVELSDPRHDHARNLWLFSYYFAGMRISDILRLRWSNFAHGRLHYAMGKNDKADSLKVPTKAQIILEKYKHLRIHADDFVFPELKAIDLTDDFVAQRTIAFKVSALDKILRKHVAPAASISTTLTMHIVENMLKVIT